MATRSKKTKSEQPQQRVDGVRLGSYAVGVPIFGVVASVMWATIAPSEFGTKVEHWVLYGDHRWPLPTLTGVFLVGVLYTWTLANRPVLEWPFIGKEIGTNPLYRALQVRHAGQQKERADKLKREKAAVQKEKETIASELASLSVKHNAVDRNLRKQQQLLEDEKRRSQESTRSAALLADIDKLFAPANTFIQKVIDAVGSPHDFILHFEGMLRYLIGASCTMVKGDARGLVTGTLFAYDEAADVSEFIIDVNKPHRTPEQRYMPQKGHGISGRCIAERQSGIFSCMDADMVRTGEGFEEVWVRLLTDGDAVIGVLSYASSEGGTFNEQEDRVVVDLFAEQITLALKLRQLHLRVANDTAVVAAKE